MTGVVQDDLTNLASNLATSYQLYVAEPGGTMQEHMPPLNDSPLIVPYCSGPNHLPLCPFPPPLPTHHSHLPRQ